MKGRHMFALPFQTDDPFTDILSDPAVAETGPNWLRWIVIAIIVIIFLSTIASAVTIVSEKTAGVVERLGRFNRVLSPGLNFVIPLFERVVYEVSLQVIQLEAELSVKTKDNVFPTMPVTVQYRVLDDDDSIKKSFYELDDPENVITSMVLNEVKAIVSTMDVEELFTSRDDIQRQTQTQLEAELRNYGFELINVLVDNPALSGELKSSYDAVTAAKRQQEAATMEAEATKIRMVGEATAEAESLTIKGRSFKEFRNQIAEGNAAAIKTMTEGTGLPAQSAMDLFMGIDVNDAIRDAAAKPGTTIVVATPRPTDGLYATLPTPPPFNGSVPVGN